MAFLDKQRGVIVARIVYDGPPEAGKTTNVRQISAAISKQRRGEVLSPGSSGSRTEFFDWLEIKGGYVQGYTLQCELVAVPGQASLRNRRKYLLDSADSVVFVADSRPAVFKENARTLASLRKILDARDPGLPSIGFLIQANKQDAAEATAPAELARQLELDHAIPVLGATATTTEGVMQTFVVAIRLAVERVQLIFNKGGEDSLAQQNESAEQLFASLKKFEILPDQLEMVTPRPIFVGGAPASVDISPAPVESAVQEDKPRPPAMHESLRIPAASEVPAGFLWPPLKARSILAAINGAAEIHRSEPAAAWAPFGAVELHSENGWILHTAEDWSFEDQMQGRNLLIRLVKNCLEHPEWVPESRTYLLAQDGLRWRLWMVSSDIPDLQQVLERALRSGHAPDILEALRSAQNLLEAVEQSNGGCGHFDVGRLAAVAVSNGSPVCLAVPLNGTEEAGDSWKARTAERLCGEVQALLAPVVYQNARLQSAVVEAIRRGNLKGLLAEEIQKAIRQPQ